MLNPTDLVSTDDLNIHYPDIHGFLFSLDQKDDASALALTWHMQGLRFRPSIAKQLSEKPQRYDHRRGGARSHSGSDKRQAIEQIHTDGRIDTRQSVHDTVFRRHQYFLSFEMARHFGFPFSLGVFTVFVW